MNINIDLFARKIVGINLENNKKSLYSIYFPNNNLSKKIEKTITYQILDENGINKGLEKKTIQIQYDLLNQPSAFTVDEIIEAKSKEILKFSNFQHIMLFEELNEKDLSIDLSSNLAHTGNKLIRILPNGQCRTNKILLNKPVKSIGMYVELDDDIEVEIGNNATSFKKLEDNQVNFQEETNSIYIKFKNTSKNEEKQIYAYGILF